MNALTKHTPTSHDYTSDQLFDMLNQYSFVSVFQSSSDGTFVATAKMRTKTIGATFEVSSKFNHPTARAALTQLHERVLSAIKDMDQRS